MRIERWGDRSGDTGSVVRRRQRAMDSAMYSRQRSHRGLPTGAERLVGCRGTQGGASNSDLIERERALVGLPLAFEVAGARSIVASQWRVSGQSTCASNSRAFECCVQRWLDLGLGAIGNPRSLSGTE